MQNNGKLWKMLANEIGRKPLRTETIGKYWQLMENVPVGLITQRSRVQILPPQPYVNSSAVGNYSAFFLPENVKKNHKLWRGFTEKRRKSTSLPNLPDPANLVNIYVYGYISIFV
jgi:hypothetical protein